MGSKKLVECPVCYEDVLKKETVKLKNIGRVCQSHKVYINEHRKAESEKQMNHNKSSFEAVPSLTIVDTNIPVEPNGAATLNVISIPEPEVEEERKVVVTGEIVNTPAMDEVRELISDELKERDVQIEKLSGEPIRPGVRPAGTYLMTSTEKVDNADQQSILAPSIEQHNEIPFEEFAPNQEVHNAELQQMYPNLVKVNPAPDIPVKIEEGMHVYHIDKSKVADMEIDPHLEKQIADVRAMAGQVKVRNAQSPCLVSSISEVEITAPKKLFANAKRTAASITCEEADEQGYMGVDTINEPTKTTLERMLPNHSSDMLINEEAVNDNSDVAMCDSAPLALQEENKPGQELIMSTEHAVFNNLEDALDSFVPVAEEPAEVVETPAPTVADKIMENSFEAGKVTTAPLFESKAIPHYVMDAYRTLKKVYVAKEKVGWDLDRTFNFLYDHISNDNTCSYRKMNQSKANISAAYLMLKKELDV